LGRKVKVAAEGRSGGFGKARDGAKDAFRWGH
jgi:hypothetical protein